MGAFDQRPRFFEGQYLSAADLSAVVDYLRGAQARQALGVHTWGIGLGLNLIENPAPGAANRREVILQPGWARDGFGRQLVVQQPTRLAESLFAAVPYNASIDGPGVPGGPVGRLVKVWLACTETSGRTPAPGFELCDAADSSSRIEEGFEFVIGGPIQSSTLSSIAAVGIVSMPPHEEHFALFPALAAFVANSLPQPHLTVICMARFPRAFVD